MRVCSVEGCGRKHRARGYCKLHYYRNRKIGFDNVRILHHPNEIIFCSDYAEMILYNKKCEEIARTKIDIEDVDKIKGYCWSMDNKGYVYRFDDTKKPIGKTRGKVIRLHRIVMNLKDTRDVDHINRDKLDNRKINLRCCSRSMNIMNSKKSIRNKSGCTGVHWDKRKNKWLSSICVNYSHKFIGYFNNFNDAVAARKAAELKYFGEIIDR